MLPKARTFLLDVLRPTLQRIDMGGEAAEVLLLGTAIQESDLLHRRQLGGGPGRGLFQMEPATHDDLWRNYLAYRPELAALARAQRSDPDGDPLDELEHNDRYAATMARLHYRRVPDPLPAADDIEAMARYWKRHYNTHQGAGRPEQFVAKWHLNVGQAALPSAR